VVRGGTWYQRNADSAGPSTAWFVYGRAGDRPVVGDWDGNGTSTPGRLRGGRWLLRNSNTAGAVDVTFGYGTGCDLGQASTSALAVERGAKPLQASLKGVELTRLPTTAKVVALTFDAGANADGVPKILAALQGSCVPGTFFLTGQWVADFPVQTRTIALRYPVGNHTFSHPDLTTLTDSQVRAQVTTAGTAILRQTRYDQRPMFRFPFGARNARTIALVNGLGYTSVRWTVDTLGWEGTSGGQSTASVVNRVLAGLTPGEIVLMHVGSNPDDHSTLDADALPTLISRILAAGYTFVTVPPSL
jgi:peptidoglycan/xylan/chitin deacetylase (PgdA/CDA1 family)